MHRGGGHHLVSTFLLTKVSDRLDGAHAHAAIKPSFKAVATGRKKIARPAVEAYTIDEVRCALSRLQVVLEAGVIGIADATVAIAVVDAMLAPDLALANMNALIREQYGRTK